ncbi:hypothetical protein [Ruegeria sp. HKCCD8929]|uniref:hypothetical protein n=1 Tax=Ruegeria sp. HKCCD8929 TaxID=2683006 RepID=UPI001582535F|nr:hypothetical protein [Ruegeria sp. HKCCD8929]
MTAYVPQGRQLFGNLTVAENIEIGLMARVRDARVREQALDLSPRLRERMGQMSGTLSIADRIAFVAGGAVAETVEARGLDSAAQQFRDYVGV